MSEPSQKKYLEDTHRLRDPETTLEIVKPHLRRMGITRIANLTGLDRVGLPTVMVTRPNSRSVAVSLGKGLSQSAAEASGVMEAIESWHAERIQLPLRLATYSELIAEEYVADVSQLPRVAGRKFEPDVSSLWIQGQDLIANRPCWVPFEMVDTDYTVDAQGGQGVFHRSTNGLASGNNVIEAGCHAIFELIERDATTLWHHRPSSGRIDLDSVDDARCRQAMDLITSAGLELGIWNTTSDIGIACFRCVIAEEGGKPGHIGIGDGCHPDRAIALLRALTEAAQTRLTYISGARDDLDLAEFTDQAQSERCAYIRDLIDQSPATRSFAECPTCSTASFEEDVELLLRNLKDVGISQVITVDLSRPELQVSVVRAVIPGLEAPHDDAGFVAGERVRRIVDGNA